MTSTHGRDPQTRGANPVGLFVVALSCVLGALPSRVDAARQSAGGLTGATQLIRAYDAIFDARFDQVPGILAQACPPAPHEACQLVDVLSRWWQIQIDPANTSRDAAFESRADAAINAADAWTEREPDSAEAWFYLGGAYGARVQWHVLRGRQISAARDGKRIKVALERALEREPELQDAYFGIGLYHYYAAVAPPAAKLLRWLLLLPGGDREKGMEEMQRARVRGQLLRSEADYQLQILYRWYEQQPERAIELLDGLQGRYPHNPHFQELIAQTEDTELHDPVASLRSYDRLLALTAPGTVFNPVRTAAMAHLGAARQLDELFESDAAIPHLRAVIDATPAASPAIVAEAQRQLARARARLSVPAYRLSLEGWRSLERGDLAEAARALTRSLALRSDDPVTIYRYAKLLFAQKHDDAALVVLAEIHKRRPSTPPTIFLLACVDAAHAKEQQGDIETAIELYRAATTVFGGDQRVKRDAQLQLARLTPPAR